RAGRGQARGRGRNHGLRRGLLPRPRDRNAAHGRGGDRHRPPGHAPHRAVVDPRRHPVPVDAAGMKLGFEWLVAWPYLRSQGSKAGRITMGAGGGFYAAAAALYLVKKHFDGVHPFQLTAADATWKNIGQWGSIAAVLVGVLVFVFGFFHSRQSLFTTI